MAGPWDKFQKSGGGPWEKYSDQENFPEQATPQPKQGIGEQLLRGTAASLPYIGGAAGGLLSIESGPGAVGGAALGYAGGKELERLANHYLLGDEIPQNGLVDEVKRVGGNALEGATYEMGGQILGKAIPYGLEQISTSPIPGKIANATNVIGKSKDLASRLLDRFGDSVPEGVKRVADVVSGAAGRAAVYKTPLGLIQGVSDTSKAVSGAQKGAAWLLDKTPQQLTPLLKKSSPAAIGLLESLIQKGQSYAE